MQKKYQVFVSSTYRDLEEERQQVMQALLELDCIPVGMELFPAADDDQWTLIKRLIDDCDYYIIILGGRYGSVNDNGVSYTQMEYEYALSNEIPIIGFVHKNRETLPLNKSETDPSLKVKLDDFDALVRRKMCQFWTNADELGSKVSRSLVKLIRDKPRSGWIKATELPSVDYSKDMLQLKLTIDRLQEELTDAKGVRPEGIDKFSQGEDIIALKGEFHLLSDDWEIGRSTEAMEVNCTWNEVFGKISPLLIGGSNEDPLKSAVNQLLIEKLTAQQKRKLEGGHSYIEYCFVDSDDFQTIKIQLRALGLMTEHKGRSNSIQFITTPYGDKLMNELRAIRR